MRGQNFPDLVYNVSAAAAQREANIVNANDLQAIYVNIVDVEYGNNNPADNNLPVDDRDAHNERIEDDDDDDDEVDLNELHRHRSQDYVNHDIHYAVLAASVRRVDEGRRTVAPSGGQSQQYEAPNYAEIDHTLVEPSGRPVDVQQQGGAAISSPTDSVAAGIDGGHNND
jgi:hypothetical protein